MRYLLLCLFLLNGCATNGTVLKVAKSQLDFATITERRFKNVFSDLESLDLRTKTMADRIVGIEKYIGRLMDEVNRMEATRLKEELKKKGGKK